nr:hypothetical protein [Tanacetum cinerariifolium]
MILEMVFVVETMMVGMQEVVPPAPHHLCLFQDPSPLPLIPFWDPLSNPSMITVFLMKAEKLTYVGYFCVKWLRFNRVLEES